MGHAAERLDVFFRLFLDHVGDVVEGDDADQAVIAVDDRRRHPIVALEQARHFFLILVGTHARPVGLHQLGDGHRALGAQQDVERDGAEEAAGFAHHIELVETVGQFLGLAHIVDGAADGPGRGRGDELGLHAPAGGILRIFQAAGQRDAFGRRQLLEDLGLVGLRQVAEDRHRIVGFELAHAFGNRLRRQFFEDFIAHRVVDFGQRGEVEVEAEQFDQARTLFRRERLQHGAEIGLVQVADQFAQGVGVAGLDALRDAFDEVGADGAVLCARRRRAGFLLEHAGPRRRKRLRAACTPGPAGGQIINA